MKEKERRKELGWKRGEERNPEGQREAFPSRERTTGRERNRDGESEGEERKEGERGNKRRENGRGGKWRRKGGFSFPF